MSSIERPRVAHADDVVEAAEPESIAVLLHSCWQADVQPEALHAVLRWLDQLHFRDHPAYPDAAR